MFEGWSFGEVLTLVGYSMLSAFAVPIMFLRTRAYYRTKEFGVAAFWLMLGVACLLVMLDLWIWVIAGIDSRSVLGLPHR